MSEINDMRRLCARAKTRITVYEAQLQDSEHRLALMKNAAELQRVVVNAACEDKAWAESEIARLTEENALLRRSLAMLTTQAATEAADQRCCAGRGCGIRRGQAPATQDADDTDSAAWPEDEEVEL